MSNYQKPNYKTTNWPAYNAALKKRGSLTIWLDPTLNWYAPLSGKRGRSATYTDQAIECCLTINGPGYPQLVKYFAEVQADPILAKFRDYTLKMVRANYKVNPTVMITTQSAGLTEKESQYMYHEYIHESMAAELVHGIKFFSQYTANGGIDNNKTPAYYPKRVLIADNASGILNYKPSRLSGKKYKDQRYELGFFF